MKNYCIIVLLVIFSHCKSEVEAPNTELYFPSLSEWSQTSVEDLGWNQTMVEELYEFLDGSNTRAFMLLKDGKIVLEHYNGKTLLGGTFTKSSNWYWASAGKTLTSTLAGIGIDEGLIDADASSSDYLGHGWSTLTENQEDQIKVVHHLTMTTGLDDKSDVDCTDIDCLNYLEDPGNRWAYHNAPYTILDGVIEGASGMDFDEYFNQKLRDPIGMDGFWSYLGYNHVYFSTARSMARFGLLTLNEGMWDGTQVVSNAYHQLMTTSSQDINQSYGYLWWLNGQESFMAPRLQLVFNGSITPSAPSDMYAAMGKNGQLINVVPSQNLVVVRMGDNPDNSLVPIDFQKELWNKINSIITP